MSTEAELVAVIPARAGSKRLPGKNRLKIGGRSLLGRTVTVAKNTPQISKIFLTTDDAALIEDTAHNSGITIRRRPAHLATDNATSEDVLRDLITAENLQKTRIALLQITSPFRNDGDITQLLDRMRQQRVNSGVSVCRYRMPASPPFGSTENSAHLGSARAETRDSNQSISAHNCWALNGAVYIFSAEEFLVTNRLYSETSAIHVMENWRSIDIDYPDDYVLAEAIAHSKGL